MAIDHQAEIQVARIASPLTLTPGITVEGGVTDVQEYDISTNTYVPDYSLTNLVLYPFLEVDDPDGEIPSGPVALANMTWSLLENGTKTDITTATAGFGIASDGRLSVKRNCNCDNPMTLRFEADYVDPRTGRTHHITESHIVACQGVSQRPILKLDTSGMIAYDPVRDGNMERKVKATFTVGGQAVDPSKYELVWRKCDSDGIWSDYDPNDPMDADLALSADKTELTVKLWLIGYRIDVRCYAKYNPYGSPSSVQIDSRTPMVEFACSRVVGRLRGSVKGARQVIAGLKTAVYELVVEDAKGIIPNPDSVLDIEWYTAKGMPSGAVNLGSMVASGAKAVIPLAFMDAKRGGIVVPKFGVKNPFALLVSDGKAVTDGGKAVIARGN